MKKIFLIMLSTFIICACGGKKSDSSSVKQGQTVYMVKENIGAVDEDSYKQMIKYCNRKDEAGLEIMGSKGLIRIMQYGESGVVTELGFGKTKIRLEDGSEYWCSREFVK